MINYITKYEFEGKHQTIVKELIEHLVLNYHMLDKDMAVELGKGWAIDDTQKFMTTKEVVKAKVLYNDEEMMNIIQNDINAFLEVANG